MDDPDTIIQIDYNLSATVDSRYSYSRNYTFRFQTSDSAVIANRIKNARDLWVNDCYRNILQGLDNDMTDVANGGVVPNGFATIADYVKSVLESTLNVFPLIG